MKELTIDELKALKVGDWVWIIDLTRSKKYSAYVQKDTQSNDKFNQLSWTLFYSDYGKTWLAYKNKEQAEAKGEIVELPFKRQRDLDGTWEVVSTHPDGFVRVEHYLGESGANKRLAELKGEKL